MAASNQPGFTSMLPSRAECLTYASLQIVFNPGAGVCFSNMAASNQENLEKKNQTCWDVPIKENQVKTATDSKKDREADKFPLIKGPTAFTFPKEQDYHIPFSSSHYRLSSGWGWTLGSLPAGRLTLPHPPLPFSFPGGTSRVVAMFSLTAKS